MTFRAKGHTETFQTARDCAAFALGTRTVMLVGFDLWMSMEGKTCLIERV